jgi:hypothetical protein
MKHTKSKKKITIIVSIILVVLILLFIVAPLGVSIGVYNSVFGERYTTYEPLAFKVSDFDGLKADRLQFTSNKGQKLIGYRYYVTDDKLKGVVIIAHGLGGGGHNSYMDSANYFAQNGYNVFAYDATGNDESEGEGTYGLPQGVIDLSYAIDFVESLDEFKDLPIMLFGHSWGGYAVCNVLNYHPEVKAVVSLSGFNKSSDILKVQGENYLGSAINLLMPYVNVYESMKFGKYAKNTALDGFANSNAGVYIVHSKDDTTVPAQYGYDIYYTKYSNDARFKFKLYENKGHSYVYCSQESLDYIDEFNAAYAEYFKTHEVTAEAKAEYINQNLDHTIWKNLLDPALYQSILSFYDSYL